MTSRERISKTLEFKRPDRVGCYDSFCAETLLEWQSQGYPPNKSPEKYFDFDFRLFDLSTEDLEKRYISDRDSNKFLTLSFSDPFEAISRRSGRLNLLREIGIDPKKVYFRLLEELDNILNSIQTFLDRGLLFHGAWVWGDLAYKSNLFFSIRDYEKCIFPVHKKLFSFLNSQNLPVIFHSDGKIDALIPYLLEAGIRALHPLDSDSGIDIRDLARRFGRDLVFFGNIDINNINEKSKMKEEIKRKFEILNDGYFYFYHASSPILPGVSLKDYKFLLETVKEFGGYRC